MKGAPFMKERIRNASLHGRKRTNYEFVQTKEYTVTITNLILRYWSFGSMDENHSGPYIIWVYTSVLFILKKSYLLLTWWKNSMFLILWMQYHAITSLRIETICSCLKVSTKISDEDFFQLLSVVYSPSMPPFTTYASSSFFKNFFTTFSSIHGVVLSASPMRNGTANRAKLTKAKASAPSFFWSSGSPKSGQWPVT